VLKFVVAAVFLAVLHNLLLIYRILTGKKVLINKRLNTYTSNNAFLAALEKHHQKRAASLKDLISRVSQVFKKAAIARRLEAELERADLPLKGEEFITITIMSSIFPALFIFAATQNFLAAIMTGVIGFIFPNMAVKLSQAKRLAQFNNQLPAALTIIANSLRAGFSFFQALELISKEMPAPIGQEFGRVLREMNLGKSTEDALESMEQRINSSDLDMVITAVLIQRQVGGNLAEVLDKISGTIRERVRIKGEIKSLTAQGRISGMIIGGLPIFLVLALSIISPEYIMLLFTHPMGIAMVAGGIISELLGLMMIQKIVNIKI
jgi:tight adherence protein B